MVNYSEKSPEYLAKELTALAGVWEAFNNKDPNVTQVHITALLMENWAFVGYVNGKVWLHERGIIGKKRFKSDNGLVKALVNECWSDFPALRHCRKSANERSHLEACHYDFFALCGEYIAMVQCGLPESEAEYARWCNAAAMLCAAIDESNIKN